MEERQGHTTFAILILALLLLTRLPAMGEYFTIDNVNLALSLEKFDPRIHQPQPPGYPFFVLSARFVNTFFHNPERISRRLDRKSTRLNSSHGYISYAVFCLKKKNKKKKNNNNK